MSSYKCVEGEMGEGLLLGRKEAVVRDAFTRPFPLPNTRSRAEAHWEGDPWLAAVRRGSTPWTAQLELLLWVGKGFSDLSCAFLTHKRNAFYVLGNGSVDKVLALQV